MRTPATEARLVNNQRTTMTLATLLVVAVVAALSGWAHSRSHDFARSRSFAVFCSDVCPILSENCSARDEKGNFVCHGRPAGANGQDDVTSPAAKLPHVVPATASSCDLCHAKKGQMRFTFAVSPAGRIETDRQRLLAYEQVKAVSAKVLRMPLGAQAGGFGLFHPGGEVCETSSDPDFQKLARWVSLERAESRGRQAPPGVAESFFRDHVLPVLARRTCLAPSCHTFNHSSFVPDPGTPGEDLTLPISERFSAEQVTYNRNAAKGLIQSLVYLTGDVEQSRFLKKIIPIESGGVLHRGGNDQFIQGKSDPDYKMIKRWLQLERAEAAGKLRSGGKPVMPALLGQVRGVVFVRTRADNYRRYLDVGKYLPGGDLYLLKLKKGETLSTAGGVPLNLTARFHAGSAADIRKPVVRYDGKAILFAMRAGVADNLNIYEIKLDDNLNYVEGSFRRLTYGPRTVNGIPVNFTDPVYVPDPTDENAGEGGYNLDRVDVVFTSNLAGQVIQSTERGIIGEADGGDLRTILDRDRQEPDHSFVGRRIYVVDGTNKGAWRTVTSFENRLATPRQQTVIAVDRPFAKPVDQSTVYVIEQASSEQPGFLPSYSVYGMKYACAGQERDIYKSTLTRITWNLGQDMDLSVRTTGEVFYGSQRAAVDRFNRPVFHMTSCRRHLDSRFSFPTHHGNRSHVPIYAANYELPSGIDIHVGMDADNLWQAGNLIVSDHQFGPDLEAKNPNLFSWGVFDEKGVPVTTGQDISNTRFKYEHMQPSHPRFVFKTIPLYPTVGAHAVSYTGVSPGGAFRDPTPLPDGSLLVSYSRSPINNFDPKANPHFDLYVLSGAPALQPAGGKGVPQVSLTPVTAANKKGSSEVEAAAIFVRIKPKINAGKRPRNEHTIRYPGDSPDTRPATYLEKNYPLIDAIMRDPSPSGKRVAYARDPVTGVRLDPSERIYAVRFVEALPMTPALAAAVDVKQISNHDPQSTLVTNGISPAKRVVAEVPLEKDGSVFCQIPSRTPMIIQSVNADGMAMRQEARYYFFAPGEPYGISPSASETFRTCGACMGSITGHPQDLFGPILPFSGSGGIEAVARAGGNPPAYGLKAEERVSVDFVRDIQPLLDRHCVSCHSGNSPAASLNLSGEKTRYYSCAYESLMKLEDPASSWWGHKKYVDEREALAIKSYLIAKVYGRQLKADKQLTGDRPHPSAELFAASGKQPAPLTDQERHLLALWIDLGAAFRSAPQAAPPFVKPTVVANSDKVRGATR